MLDHATVRTDMPNDPAQIHYHTRDLFNGVNYTHWTRKDLDRYLDAEGREMMETRECSDACVEDDDDE
jgi:hypothetical protein